MPYPREGESRGEYVQRYVMTRRREHPEEKVKQSVAICYAMWRERGSDEKEDKTEPE